MGAQLVALEPEAETSLQRELGAGDFEPNGTLEVVEGGEQASRAKYKDLLGLNGAPSVASKRVCQLAEERKPRQQQASRV